MAKYLIAAVALAMTCYVVLTSVLLLLDPSKWGRMKWIPMPDLLRRDLDHGLVRFVLRFQGLGTIILLLVWITHAMLPGVVKRLGFDPWRLLTLAIGVWLIAVGVVVAGLPRQIRPYLPGELIAFVEGSLIGNVIVRVWGLSMLGAGVVAVRSL